jgi:hypothetical protein
MEIKGLVDSFRMTFYRGSGRKGLFEPYYFPYERVYACRLALRVCCCAQRCCEWASFLCSVLASGSAQSSWRQRETGTLRIWRRGRRSRRRLEIWSHLVLFMTRTWTPGVFRVRFRRHCGLSCESTQCRAGPVTRKSFGFFLFCFVFLLQSFLFLFFKSPNCFRNLRCCFLVVSRGT